MTSTQDADEILSTRPLARRHDAIRELREALLEVLAEATEEQKTKDWYQRAMKLAEGDADGSE